MLPLALRLRGPCNRGTIRTTAGPLVPRAPWLVPRAALSTARVVGEPASTDSPFRPYAETQMYTQLPTPLPLDVRDRHMALRRKGINLASSALDEKEAQLIGTSPLSIEHANTDEIYFPTSRSIETLALFQACLSTGLISRAHKLMQEMRAESHGRLRELYEGHAVSADHVAPMTPLKLWSYNAMLHAYFAKALEPEAEDSKVWVGHAWKLWDDMMKTDKIMLDPRPDASTIATMAMGVSQLQDLGIYPRGRPDLLELLRGSRKLNISLDSVFSSTVRQNGLANAAGSESSSLLQGTNANTHALLKGFRAAAAQLGDLSAQKELDQVADVLDKSEVPTEAPVDASPTLDAPEVRPVMKKDKATDTLYKPFNLRTLQESLEMMKEARTRTSDIFERQRWLEHSALEAARKRLEHDTEKLQELGLDAGHLQSKTLQSWMWDWYRKLEETLRKDLERLSRQTKHQLASSMDMQLYPFLCLLPPSKMAMIVILELMRMQGISGVADGIKTTRALITIGKAIENEYSAVMMNKHPEIFIQARHAQQMLGKRNLVNLAMRRDIKAWQERCKEENIASNIPKWTQIIRARVGSYLVNQLLHVATVKRQAYDREGELWEEEQPAFYSAYEYIQGKKLGVIRLNEVVSQRLDKESVRETLHPRHLPMLVPPRPWLTHDSGGYFSVKTSAMRYKDSVEQSSYLRAASANNGLEVVLAGLDVLGNTAWNVNREVFDVVLQVWNSGEALADLPPAEMTDPEPERPPPDDIKAKGIYLQRLRQWNSIRAANHSQRCDINYKLEIARSFLGEKFYFPHNMDFRGRAYPIPPHLNHIGNDLCRGLLKFAEAKPLGEVGLRWLHIHLANVWGYDKASFAEREQFTKRHADLVKDSATKPLEGKRWWLEADDPWQCLATCIELNKAWNYAEGPEAFPSQLPVHQDGTCNGLQHYAALGGDLQGAKQVNLRGGDRPADVYTGVAELVIAQLTQRAEAGDETAKLLCGKVTRKVVKQTVMTTVYGVTFIGAKNQVMRQLADRGDVPAEELWSAASYLAKVIMDCIGDLFSGANLIQDWLTISARLIAKSIPPERIAQAQLRDDKAGKRSNSTREGREQMTSVIWTSALGLPVVQPYRKIKKHQITTAVQSVYIRDPNQNYEVNPSKQASAFPPNFIHSLDATHMFLTALECHSAGLVFASVHDSYWTHACDIDTMSDIIRDTFVRLHSQDILVRLRDEFLQRYKGYKIPASSLAYTRAKVARARTEEPVETEAAEADAEDAEPVRVDLASLTQCAQAPDENSFYNLADLLPPIPQKGGFDVSEIKRSLYFFS
ncbi:DNA-directed RNA polymerase [Malassezia equina]|uniref:DNA-directed RNA polymerase n=1 Tax=Malassezia equina TaxID=1381935 RepID=A0AAF0EIR9_9BASI|nr:DNA-directed RNA polymerase [Malassezia equina]